MGAEVLSNHHLDSDMHQPAKPDFIPDILNKDLTPFVQGVYWQVVLVAHSEVQWDLKEKEAIDQLVKSVLADTSETPQGASENSARAVSIKVTTLEVRVKEQVSQRVEYEFPVSRLCYCGTDATHQDVFTFVTKEDRPESDGTTHHGYVFRCHSPEKARVLAMCVAKAYHLAFRVWREEHGLIADHPERASIFEPYPSNEEEIHKARTPEMLRRKLDEFLGSNSSGEEIESPQPKPKPKPRVDRRPSVLQSEHGEEMSAAFLELIASKRPGLVPTNIDSDEMMRLTIGALSKHSDPGSLESLLH